MRPSLWRLSFGQRPTTAAASGAKVHAPGVAAWNGQAPWDPASNLGPAEVGASKMKTHRPATSHATAMMSMDYQKVEKTQNIQKMSGCGMFL
jgi:hypothetical protein